MHLIEYISLLKKVGVIVIGNSNEIRTVLFDAKWGTSKILNGRGPLDEQINQWLEENKNVSVMDIKFSSHCEGNFYDEGRGELEGYYTALVIYKLY